jgi:hypothetical protein
MLPVELPALLTLTESAADADADADAAGAAAAAMPPHVLLLLAREVEDAALRTEEARLLRAGFEPAPGPSPSTDDAVLLLVLAL